MDQYQALSLVGFDGPDWLSPKAEIQEEIDRLEAMPLPHHEILKHRIRYLQDLFETATEAGGFVMIVASDATSSEIGVGIDPQKYADLKLLFDRRLDGVDVESTPKRQLFVLMLKPLADFGLKRSQIEAMAPYFEYYLKEKIEGHREMTRLVQQQKPSNPAQSPDKPPVTSSPQSSVNWDRAAQNAQTAIREGQRLSQNAKQNLKK